MKRLIICMLLLATIVSATTTFSAQTPTYGGTFIVCVQSDPSNLNPALGGLMVPRVVTSAIYQGLIKLDRNADPQPELAESWDVSTNASIFTFHLVQNATWHDGVAFTSADVKFTFEKVLNKYHGRFMSIFKNAEEVLTPDNYTVVVKFKVPNGAFMNVLSLCNGAILPEHLYNGTDILNNPHNSNPVGTGPFKFKEWVKGQYVEVVKNENYYRTDQPYLDRIVYKIITDPEARVAAFENAEVDYLYYWALPVYDVARLQNMTWAKVTLEPSEPGTVLGLLFFNLNGSREVLLHKEVRQAIAYAINKTYIVEKARYGQIGGREGRGPIASTDWAFNPNITTYEYNITKANELLDAAGYPKVDGTRFALNLVTSTDYESYIKACEIIKEELKEVGISITLKVVDEATRVDLVYIKKDYDLSLNTLTTAPEPAIGVARLYYSGNIKPAAYSNGASYNNSRVDYLLDMAAATVAKDERKIYYNEFQEIVVDELPVLTVFEEVNPSAWRNDYVDIMKYQYSYETLSEVWWTEGQALTSPSFLEANWMWIAAAVAVVVIVPTLAYMVIRSRKRRPPKT